MKREKKDKAWREKKEAARERDNREAAGKKGKAKRKGYTRVVVTQRRTTIPRAPERAGTRQVENGSRRILIQRRRTPPRVNMINGKITAVIGPEGNGSTPLLCSSCQMPLGKHQILPEVPRTLQMQHQMQHVHRKLGKDQTTGDTTLVRKDQAGHHYQSRVSPQAAVLLMTVCPR